LETNLVEGSPLCSGDFSCSPISVYHKMVGLPALFVKKRDSGIRPNIWRNKACPIITRAFCQTCNKTALNFVFFRIVEQVWCLQRRK